MLEAVTRKLLTRAEKFPVLRLLLPFYALLAVLFAWLISRGNVQLLNPAGTIADLQSKLLWGVIIFAAFLGSVMIGGFFIVAFRYREDKGRVFTPEWHAGTALQIVGWGVPFLVLSSISVVVWITAHQVDPYKPLTSSAQPITIQVVALQWKWLILYPHDHIATVNALEIPVNTPISLELTADAPMNSFWIPQLSGQMYAMTGMVTQLHIMANKTGIYAGGPAEISGGDFADMTFKVHVVTSAAYATWKSSFSGIDRSKRLNLAQYQQLAKPAPYTSPDHEYYLADQNLFDAIVMQFMTPATVSGGSA